MKTVDIIETIAGSDLKVSSYLIIIVCPNDDPRVTLACFTARSNLVT